MIEVETPAGIAEFPDGTPPETIKAALAKKFGAPGAKPEPVGGLRAFGMGALRGLRDPLDAGAQMLARGIESVFPSYKGQREQTETVNRAAEQDYQQNWLEGKGQGVAATGGRITGNVAATLPATMAVPGLGAATLAPRIAAGAGAGAIAGSLTPLDIQGDQSFWEEKAKQAALGAAVGGGTSAALNAVGRALAPVGNKAASALRDSGVRLTPGQQLGGVAANLEEKAGSLPIVGNFIGRARDRATADFNRATINKALAPIGEKIDDAIPAGHEAITAATKKASEAYRALLPGLTTTADDTLISDLATIGKNASLAPGNIGEKVAGAIDEHILNRISASQTLTGAALKEAESELGRMARMYMRSQVASERHFAQFLLKAQSALRSAVERSNPDKASALKAANKAWSNMTRIWEAGYLARGADGVFTPKQLMQGVVNADRYLGRRGIAQGQGNMQAWAGDASRVIGNTVPDSGTAGRVAAMAMLASPAVALPFSPMAAAGLGAMTLPYTALGQRASNALLSSRPQAMRSLGGLLGRSAAPASPAAAYGLLGAMR